MATVYAGDMAKLLTEAFNVSNAVDMMAESGLLIVPDEELPQLFFQYITRAVTEHSLLFPEYVHCARYAAECCADLLHNSPRYETVFEYLREGYRLDSSEMLHRGADLCFLMVTLFPGRLERRSVDRSYYTANGRGFYDSWHRKSRQPRMIGLYMSQYFEFISDATARGMRMLRAPHLVR